MALFQQALQHSIESSNGKTIANIINPQASAVASLRGVLKGAPEDLDRHHIREERLSQYEPERKVIPK